jgi:hypothetical protein
LTIRTRNHGISKAQVKQTTCKSGAPTLDGGRSLFTNKNTSAISNPPTDVSMSQVEKMLKVKKSKYGIDTMVPTKDGRFFILTRRLRLKLRVSTRNSVSTSTDHST